jgi:hypothetical protein
MRPARPAPRGGRWRGRPFCFPVPSELSLSGFARDLRSLSLTAAGFSHGSPRSFCWTRPSRCADKVTSRWRIAGLTAIAPGSPKARARGFLLRPSGRPFPSPRIDSAASSPCPLTEGLPKAPYGLGVTRKLVDSWRRQFEWAGSAEALAADPEAKPLSEHGAIGNGRRGSDTTSTSIGRGSAYLVARLKRDHPAIAAALARGEYKSARRPMGQQ